jgi:uncharacterized protein
MDHYDHLIAGARCLNRQGATVTEQAQAFRLFSEAASRGSSEGMEEVARMLATGRGVRRSPEAALHYYQLAVAAGSVTAYAAVAAMLGSSEDGFGDQDSAAEFYADGAGLGDVAALLGLARMRRDGQGGPRDLTAARVLFRQAVRAGSWQAAYELASLNLHEDHFDEAWAWLDMATQLGAGPSVKEEAALLAVRLSAEQRDQARHCVLEGLS